MKIRRNFVSKRASAFTLIEVMIVIAIILVLATMSIGGLGWYKRKAAEGKTKVFMESLSRALEDYRSDTNEYPPGDGSESSTQEMHRVLYAEGTATQGGTVYLDALDPNLSGNKLNVLKQGSTVNIVDGWFIPLRYTHPGVMNPEDDFDLLSYGPNGRTGSQGTKNAKDDIKNW